MNWKMGMPIVFGLQNFKVQPKKSKINDQISRGLLKIAANFFKISSSFFKIFYGISEMLLYMKFRAIEKSATQ